MDAIQLIKSDHRMVEELFARFEALTDRAVKQKRKIVDDVVKALSMHAAIEEQLLYPAIREQVKDMADHALEAIEEHHVVKWLLEEVRTMSPEHERFTPKMTVLMENVRHHIKEEEKDLLPALRRALGKDKLEQLGNAMAAAKRFAPTRPHPRSPDAPPGNLVAGPMAAVLDRGRDAIRSLTGRGAKMAEEAMPKRGNGGGKAKQPKAAMAKMAKLAKNGMAKTGIAKNGMAKKGGRREPGATQYH